jgi:5-methylthioadenosine/S-adenosylhomocysteine deaminase
MELLIEHVDLLDLETLQVEPDRAIAVQGNRIAALGRAPDGFEPQRRLDASGCLALPGLYNAHCHSPMTLVRGWAEDLPFDRWLNERIWVAESALEEEDVYWGAALAACEMLRAGVVGFADHYFWMDRVARVVEESGMKALLGWCLFGTGPQHEVGAATFDTVRSFAERWHLAAGGRIRTALAPHSPYMCPPELLRRMADAAGQLGVPIHIHLAESDEQVQRSREQHGKSPVAHVASLGLLEPGLLAAHCIAVDERDLALLAREGVFVAHTPKTYMKLAMRMAPLSRQLDAGVRVALGSDGPASSGDLNLLEVMRLTGLTQKLERGDASAAPLSTLLRLATAEGAAALGFEGAGRLAVGAPADIVLMRTDRPHWIPRHNLAAGVVYASHPSDVVHVVVDGQLVLEGGRLLTLDEERIRSEAERRASRMVGAQMSQVRTYRG